MKSEPIARDKLIKSTLHKLWPRDKWTLLLRGWQHNISKLKPMKRELTAHDKR